MMMTILQRPFFATDLKRIFLFFFSLLPVFSMANVQLPSVISSKMVLQREMAVPIWGLADPGEEVTVTLNGQTVKSTAGSDGKWLVKLSPMKEGGPFSMTIAGKNSIELENVLIGEVWLCSGETNMAYLMKNDAESATEIPPSENPRIRIFVTPKTSAEAPQLKVEGNWELSRPWSIADSSAVAYYFAKKLQAELGLPVGLLQSNYGGTSADSWIDQSILERDPDFKPILERWTQDVASYPAKLEEFKSRMEVYEKESEEAKSKGVKPTKAPQEPRGKIGSKDSPSGCYNAMLHPHIPYAIRGVIWYHGESNAKYGYQYRKLLPALIQSWRQVWGQGEFPFLIVQLPNMIRKSPPQPPDWAELREAQLLTFKNVPNTGLITTIDVGDPKEFQPKSKRPFGERLALAAMGVAYGKSEEWMGPVYKSMKVENGKIRLSFEHIGRGLVSSEGALKGFTIAGEGKIFFPAEAVIEGETIVVSNFQTDNPMAVRYGWGDNPPCSLFNKDGFPASPFRTDDWPESTFDNR
jgi:sialate O-acetylesterase